jgi:hypothetical protein
MIILIHLDTIAVKKIDTQKSPLSGIKRLFTCIASGWLYQGCLPAAGLPGFVHN